MTEPSIENELELIAEPTPGTKLDWHAPGLTRVEIKRTLFDGGSINDLSTGNFIPTDN